MTGTRKMADARETPRATAGDTQTATFEQAFARLEETVRQLESGKLSLDESMRLFEQGMALSKRCHELLSTAELKVTRLQSAFAEQMKFLQEDEAGNGRQDTTP